MGTKNTYLPTKYWLVDGELHRAFFEYEEYCDESPREWCNLSKIVNCSKYSLCGSDDIDISRCYLEDWLIEQTGIDSEWYYDNSETFGGIDALVNKFAKEKCVALEWLTVYDHSGITVSCGRGSGWDYSIVGFAYVAKDNKEVKAYRKNHTLDETKEWASHILHCEIHTLDNWCQGNVYRCVEEIYDTETDSWDDTYGDIVGNVYLNDETCQCEQEDAVLFIKDNFAGKHELLDEDVVEKALEENTLDVLDGQQLFEFMESA